MKRNAGEQTTSPAAKLMLDPDSGAAVYFTERKMTAQPGPRKNPVTVVRSTSSAYELDDRPVVDWEPPSQPSCWSKFRAIAIPLIVAFALGIAVGATVTIVGNKRKVINCPETETMDATISRFCYVPFALLHAICHPQKYFSGNIYMIDHYY